MAFTQPHQKAAEPKRDGYGRPLIQQPNGPPIAYTRISTVAKCLDDTGGLVDWKLRRAVYGMAIRPDLIAKASAMDPANPDDDKKLREVFKDADAAAASSTAANYGTAVHAWTEHADNGRDLSKMPAELRPDVEAYLRATRGLGMRKVLAEKFVVIDELQCAGSFDGMWMLPDWTGQHLPTIFPISDTKTGLKAVDHPHNIAIQIAMYSRGQLYDIETGERTPLGADQHSGILLHTPLGTGKAAVYRLDLDEGWAAAQVARWVHSTWRKNKNLVTMLGEF